MDSKNYHSQTSDQFGTPSGNEENIILARIAVISKRYEDAIEFCQTFLTLSRDLNRDERSVLMEAYKGHVNQFRQMIWKLSPKRKESEKIQKEYQKYVDALNNVCSGLIV